jgi:xanthine dehydrogenase accessory factor
VRGLVDRLERWRAEGVDAGRAVVVRTFGSAPRPEGAVLLYADDGRLAGSVSGGCVEGAAAEEIRRARATGLMRVVRYGISDQQAWDVGLACGGTIDVMVQPSVPREVLDAVRAADRTGGIGTAVITPLPPGSSPQDAGARDPGNGVEPARPIVIDEQGRMRGAAGSPATDEALREAALGALRIGRSSIVEAGGLPWFVEAYAVRPRLVIVGAVEVARSLVALAREVGFETIVVDGRAAFATAERFPSVDRLVVAWPDEAAELIGLGPNDAVAVLTHDAKFDEPAIVTALHRGCRYVGAVGSRKTQVDRRRRLLAAGATEDELVGLRGPIGLDLGGREPAETALAILAEIVADRHGGSGVPMRDRSARASDGSAVPGQPPPG